MKHHSESMFEVNMMNALLLNLMLSTTAMCLFVHNFLINNYAVSATADRASYKCQTRDAMCRFTNKDKQSNLSYFIAVRLLYHGFDFRGGGAKRRFISCFTTSNL